MIKTSIVCFVLVGMFLKNALTITEEQRTQIQSKFLEIGSKCIKEYPLAVDDLKSFKNKVFPDGSNAGCFAACVFNKVGLFDDKGTLSHTTALKNARNVFEDEEELESISEFLTTCAKVNDEEVTDGVKGCERAKLAFECFAKNYEQFGFNIDF